METTTEKILFGIQCVLAIAGIGFIIHAYRKADTLIESQQKTQKLLR